jgi:uncharacterized protein YidB (DUF937 family)
MGLLDTVMGALAGGQGGQGSDASGGGGQAALIAAVLGMLTNSANGASAGGGGLGDLLARFEQAGLGDAAQSWVGTGANQAVSADQISSALGSDTIAQLAQQIGLPAGDTAGHLSELLPQVIDRLTPNGAVPEAGVSTQDLAGFEGLGDLLGRFGRA